MSTVASPIDETRAVNDRPPPVPFACVHVTLTKQEHIQLVMDVKRWKGLHRRATERLEWSERRHQHEVLELKHEAARRAESVMKATSSRWRALRQRVIARTARHELRVQQELREFKDQAEQREALLRAELELALAKVRDLQQAPVWPQERVSRRRQ